MGVLFSLVVAGLGQEPATLLPGVAVHGELSGETSHFYKITLLPDRLYRISVEQQGRDVVVLLWEGGRRILAVNNPIGKRGPEWLFPPSGSINPFRLEIKPRYKGVAAAPYRVILEFISTEDPRRLRAQKAISRASAHYFEKNRQAALEQLEEALTLWQESQDSRRQAMTLFAMGKCAGLLSRRQKALNCYGRAQPLWEGLGDDFHSAQNLNGMGLAFLSSGDHRAALPLFQRALELFKGSGDSSWLAAVGTNLGHTYDLLGEPEQAKARYLDVLEVYRLAGDRRRQAFLWNNMGELYRRTDHWQEALDCFARALTIIQEVGSRLWQARLLNNMGFIYLTLDKPEMATVFFERALPLRREVGDKRGEAATLSNLGRAKLRMGRLREARETFTTALEMGRARGDQIAEAVNLDALGIIALQRGDPGSASAFFQKTLALLEPMENRRKMAGTLSHLGEAALLGGELERAESFLKRALLLHRAVRNPAMEANTLVLMADLAVAHDRLDRARSHSEAAVALVESLRGRIGSRDLRISWFAMQRSAYEGLIEVLMASHRAHPEMGFDLRALTVSERARARVLLELLHETGAGLLHGIEPKLRQRREKLLSRLAARSRVQLRLLGNGKGNIEAAAAERDVQEMLIALDELDTQIRKAHPGYAALFRPQPLQAERIAAELDPETMLLEYFVGSERSYLWALTQKQITAYELPGRAELARAAGRFYRLMATVDPADRVVQTQAALTLSRMLLGPVSDRLGKRRLLFVADDMLHYVPFAALPDPGPIAPNRTRPGNPPLILKHEITMLSSATILALPSRNSARPARPESEKMLIILADPVFHADDPRLKKIIPEADFSTTTGPTSARLTRGDLSFSRLPSSRREALAIAAIAGSRRCRLSLDFEASRKTVLEGGMDAYQYLHFATHGLLNDAHPELSAMVLSLYDERGRPLQGFLTLPDIFNLKLNADLVVLSGCRTGLGKTVHGEGVIGLVRGFRHAGADQVVATLWQVEDKATAVLMEHFYRALLHEGKTAPAALREAQLSLWRKRRYRDPWHWAGFAIYGD